MAGAPRHIASLDGLRAVSFLLVFVAHVGLERYVPGGFGVTIFFFLSGYLITTLMRAEWESRGRVHLGHFWLRRALRILPPFYLVLGATVLLTIALQGAGVLDARAVMAQALHYSNYWIIGHGYAGLPVGTGVYWSLAVEEHFYLLFPWLYLLMVHGRLNAHRQALILWGLCLAVLAWRAYLILHLHAEPERAYLASDTRVDSILFGCALAVWKNPVLDVPLLNERRWKWLYLPIALLVLVACILIRGVAFRETLRYSLQGAALTVVFVAAIRFSDWPLFRPLNSRLAKFLGLLSYSLYLLHFVVIAAVWHLLPGMAAPLSALIALSVSIGLSWVIYRLVEKPCAGLRRRLID